jgi:protein O-GlcNAcase/histone acetyltransferase
MSTDSKGLFGVVEGFYGRPWTAAQRRTLFGWLNAGGLNAYLYAPKDDAKHRAIWRERYTDTEAAELRALVHDCRDAGVRFIYALSPGLDIRFDEATEVAALRAKLEQVHGLGVRDFAVLFDDINPELSDADRRKFGTPAGAQAYVGNAILDWVRAWDSGGAVLLCPTEYCGRFATPSVGASPYLRTLGERLDPAVEVLWTGPEIISETIPVSSLRELRDVLRRKPVLWDNLHANDYDMRRLYLGPYAGRPGALLGEIGGILQNPNCQFEANFVPVRTLGAYVRQGSEYSRARAYAEAIAAWQPAFTSRRQREFTLADVQLTADLFHLPTENGVRAEGYLADLRVLLGSPPNSWGEAAVRFEQTTRQIVALYDKATELADRPLLYALYTHLWEIKETALLLGEWAHWRRQHPESQEPFRSTNFRPGIHRGGVAATIERLLPMDAAGGFAPTTSAPS